MPAIVHSLLHTFSASSKSPAAVRQNSIHVLPNEILRQIFIEAAMYDEDSDAVFRGWQYPEFRYSVIRNLSSTCKLFYMICAPLLWKDQDFPLTNDEETGEGTNATDASEILSRRALFFERHVGSYVESISRNLNLDHDNDLKTSEQIAKLIPNLRSLRLEFNKEKRYHTYGLKYFAENCPHLNEINIQNCTDEFDDFKSLVTYPRRLKSITLINSTINIDTLREIARICKPTLRQLLLQYVRPHGLHEMIPTHIYHDLFRGQNLTNIAITDASLTAETIAILVAGSPNLRKLAMLIEEQVQADDVIIQLSTLTQLATLSLAWRRVYTEGSVRIRCETSFAAWNKFAVSLPSIKYIHITALGIKLPGDFFLKLFETHPDIPNVMFHHIDGELTTFKPHMKEYSRRGVDYFSTYDGLVKRGFDCFTTSDQFCFVKGFEDWTKTD
ncbi:hypothetical protein BC937DRAFT_90304 [Endogone sp. FLAS-F59071]|nr:hypothetical protein BC937DRAFT_90304 [Endogone sp. FLAS-F59071]|eukprot:RUS17174.1 hypothetical protein BC937DRAFT_90304 [Endogone sp. FLAS-F59071]